MRLSNGTFRSILRLAKPNLLSTNEKMTCLAKYAAGGKSAFVDILIRGKTTTKWLDQGLLPNLRMPHLVPLKLWSSPKLPLHHITIAWIRKISLIWSRSNLNYLIIQKWEMRDWLLSWFLRTNFKFSWGRKKQLKKGSLMHRKKIGTTRNLVVESKSLREGEKHLDLIGINVLYPFFLGLGTW